MSIPTQPANTPDDLDAVRKVIEALAPFQRPDQERILRWAEEKLGIPRTAQALHPNRPAPPNLVESGNAPAAGSSAMQGGGGNIRDFVATKNPKSDNQFAAVVAYYFRFEAPAAQRKDCITAEDLKEAGRQARRAINNPKSTLNNAHSVGLLDRETPGEFTVNAVGENLVSMTLPAPSGSERVKQARRRSSKSAKQVRRSTRAKAKG